ncbi:MAG TPA: asparaginase domain-containing protein, partial [Chitinophagales bacterium]|nr:asparaginase domain-containing protein [Chitinophagales bacterium]
MQIRLFITGGTFDKEYNELDGTLFFEDTHVPEMLELGRCKLDVNIRTLMMIDSLQMSDDDRVIIAHNCLQCDEEKIVITHGTDTMVETAKVLAEKI